jgi:hypothetical protein
VLRRRECTAVESAAELDQLAGLLGGAPLGVERVGVEAELRLGINGVERTALGQHLRPLLTKLRLELVRRNVQLVGLEDGGLGGNGVVAARRDAIARLSDPKKAGTGDVWLRQRMGFLGPHVVPQRRPQCPVLRRHPQPRVRVVWCAGACAGVRVRVRVCVCVCGCAYACACGRRCGGVDEGAVVEEV